MPKIEYDCECDTCKGTGLYVGLGEKDGSAVVCHCCDGTGKQHVRITYNDFEGKKKLPKIKRVFEANPGIGIGEGKIQNGLQLELKDFGGMDYKDWLDGKRFPKGSEMRKFTCPAWWYQTVDYSKKPEWETCIGYGSFSACKKFKEKGRCWERWDKEHNK